MVARLPTLGRVPFPRRWSARLRATWRSFLREASAFGVVGATCFALDVALFQLCYAHLGSGPVVAKVVSTSVSTTVAFVGHRYWSFSRRARTGLGRESLLFGVVNGATLILGVAIIATVRYPLGQESALVLQAANIGSIVLGTVVRYLAYRRWVFPAHATPAAARAAVPARAVVPRPLYGDGQTG